MLNTHSNLVWLSVLSIVVFIFVVVGGNMAAHGKTCMPQEGEKYCGSQSSCNVCRDDVIGLCIGGKFEGRKCQTATDVLLCKEGGGTCNLIPKDDPNGPQHAFPSCTSENGKCACKCKGIINLGLCDVILQALCEQLQDCRCDSAGTCTFPVPCN